VGDGHPLFNMKGSEMGKDDIIDMLGSLFEIGYLKKDPTGKLPTVSLEVKPPPDGDRQATFKESIIRFLKRGRNSKRQSASTIVSFTFQRLTL